MRLFHKTNVICFIFLLNLGCAFFSEFSFAQNSAPYIAIGSAKTRKTVIAFPEIKVDGATDAGRSKSISEVVTKDLNFTDLFKFLDSSSFIEDSKKAGVTLESFKFKDWQSIGADILVKAAITHEPGGILVLEGHVYEVTAMKQILAKRYLASQAELKTMGHTFANDIVKSLTGLPGIFLTKIAMSCDLSGKKEIYVMNFDGSDVKQITRHRSIAFAPAWSPDGSKIAYSLFTRHKNNLKNIDLYEYDFTSSSVRLLSNRRGINGGAAYSPDGKKIALTLSFQGNPEIFLLNLVPPFSVSRITQSFGFDVDPAWSPDGKNITFVSSRTGIPMIFSMNSDGKNVQRLTFAGKYNATPSWSPQNNKIAFAGWIDKNFDIFIMNPDGTHIERLSKGQGNNEDPMFSPDGNFIVFSSNRTGQKNIYVMNVDGTFVKRLTYGLGNCVAPKWSLPPPGTS